MRAYILCGGFGTRLKSVIKNTQKAMVDVDGQPFLLKVLEQLVTAEIQEVVLCAHYRADQVANSIPILSEQTGLSLYLVVEPIPLGTGGALLNALQTFSPKGRYLVLNADTFLDAQAYSQLIISRGNALTGVHVDDRSRYGSLTISPTGFLCDLREKGVDGAGFINAGAYAFESDAFSSESVSVCSLERDLLPRLLAREPIKLVEYAGRFIDIGTPETLEWYAENYKEN